MDKEPNARLEPTLTNIRIRTFRGPSSRPRPLFSTNRISFIWVAPFFAVVLVLFYYIGSAPPFWGQMETGIFVGWAISPQAAADSVISFYKSRDAQYGEHAKLLITSIKVVPSQNKRRFIDLNEEMPQITFSVKGRVFSFEDLEPYLDKETWNLYHPGTRSKGVVAILALSKDALNMLSYGELVEIVDMLKVVRYKAIYLTYLD